MSTYCEDYRSSSSLFHNILNGHDQPDENLNIALFAASLAYSELILDGYIGIEDLIDPSHYNSSFEAVSTTVNSTLGIGSRFEYALNSVTNCSSDHNYSNMSDLLADMEYLNTNYYPGIYFYNLDEATVTDELIIAISAEIDSLDRIPGWKISDDQSISQVLVNEADSTNNIPILIITNNTDEYIDSEDDITVEDYDEGGGRSSFQTIVDEHRANYRYEGSGKTDYFVTARAQSAATNFGFYGNTKGIEVRSMSSNQINVNFTNDKNFNIFLTYGGLVCTYERDWNNSKKDVTVSGWTSYPLEVRMKYTNEFYQRMYVSNITKQTVTSTSKGKLRIKFP